MRKIRIGNDIRLKLKISINNSGQIQNTNDSYEEKFDKSNIKQLRCYLINTSVFKQPSKEDEPRFKRVGFPDFYRPTANNINNCGFPSYHMAPANVCNYDRFSPDFHDYHWWPGFRGFGLHPEHFHDHHNKPIDNNIFLKDYEYNDCYLADSYVLNDKNLLSCMFPAIDQKYCGTYKLVVIITAYEYGWGRNNLRTYTIDKGDIFELVDDNSGESGYITMDVDDSGSKENQVKSLYTLSCDGNYTMAAGTSMKLGDKDADQENYLIQVELKDNTKILYNAEHWAYDKLLFSSDNEDLVTVDEFGTLYAKDFECYNKKDSEWPSVCITVRTIDNDVRYQFTVTVKDMDTIRIGFSEEDDPDYIHSMDKFFRNYNAKSNNFTVGNFGSVDAKYLWILSLRKMHYVKGQYVKNDNEEEDDTLIDNGIYVSSMSSGFRIPLIQFMDPIDGYFCYRSVSPILSGNVNMKIKFA